MLVCAVLAEGGWTCSVEVRFGYGMRLTLKVPLIRGQRGGSNCRMMGKDNRGGVKMERAYSGKEKCPLTVTEGVRRSPISKCDVNKASPCSIAASERSAGGAHGAVVRNGLAVDIQVHRCPGLRSVVIFTSTSGHARYSRG